MTTGVGHMPLAEFLAQPGAEVTEARRVDVALVRTERLEQQRKKVFHGSSELVV